ncbi:MAG: class I SAM-dependent methyltransferase, partial [Candidatus Thorarchaeota archaeon]
MQSLTESIRNSGLLDIRNRLESISGGKVLDIGTQHGDFIRAMMKSMKNYEAFVGIDISEKDLEEKDLEKARESFPDDPVEFELMNAEALSFDDDSFDTVCLSYSLHHLENVEVVLREMMRV